MAPQMKAILTSQQPRKTCKKVGPRSVSRAHAHGRSRRGRKLERLEKTNFESQVVR